MLGEVQVGYIERFLLRKSGETVAQAAEGAGGLTVSIGVKERGRCGSGLEQSQAWAGGWSRLSVVFPALMIPRFYDCRFQKQI